MKRTWIQMGMPITVEIVDPDASGVSIEKVKKYFEYIDETFSPFKDTSEVSRFNRSELSFKEFSEDMKTIMKLCDQTKKQTMGYFDPMYKGTFNPSGIVKGWAIRQASEILKETGASNYYVDAGGDIQVSGNNSEGKPWIVGIRNPFKRDENVKVLSLFNVGIATSGTAIRGQHIYNPHQKNQLLTEVVSLSVVGPNVYEADRFATAAFAMGKKGVAFIETLQGFEGYSIDTDGVSTYTTNFTHYLN